MKRQSLTQFQCIEASSTGSANLRHEKIRVLNTNPALWQRIFDASAKGLTGNIGTQNNLGILASPTTNKVSQAPSIHRIGRNLGFSIKPNIHAWQKIGIPPLKTFGQKNAIVYAADLTPVCYLPLTSRVMHAIADWSQTTHAAERTQLAPLQTTHNKPLFQYKIHTCRIKSILEATIRDEIPLSISLCQPAVSHTAHLFLTQQVQCGKWLHLLSKDSLFHLQPGAIKQVVIQQFATHTTLSLRGIQPSHWVDISTPTCWRKNWELLLARFEPVNYYLAH